MKIKSIKIQNFRNVIEDEFDVKQLNIWKGKNELGKSNRINAIVFLLLGKVLTDKVGAGENDIDTVLTNSYDEQGHRPECKVSATLENGQVITRVYRENWVRKRGSIESVYEGNVTELYNNDSSVNQSEWLELINQLFDVKSCGFKHKELNILQAYIDPLYLFQKVDYKVLRGLLEYLVGNITMEDIIQAEPACDIAKTEILKYSGDAAKARTGVYKVINDKTTGLDAKINEIEAQLRVIPQGEIDEVKRKELSDKAFAIQLNIKNLKESPSTEVDDLKLKLEKANRDYEVEYNKILNEVSTNKNGLTNAYLTNSKDLQNKLNESRENDLTKRKNTELLNAQSELATLKQQSEKITSEMVQTKIKHDNLKFSFNALENEIKVIDMKSATQKEVIAHQMQEVAPVTKCPHCGGVLNEEHVKEFENNRSKSIENAKASIYSLEQEKADKTKRRAEITNEATIVAGQYKALTEEKTKLDVKIESQQELVNQLANAPFEQYSEETKKLEKCLKELEEGYENAINVLANQRDEAFAKLQEENSKVVNAIRTQLQLAQVNAETFNQAKLLELQAELGQVQEKLNDILLIEANQKKRQEKLQELEQVQIERNNKQMLYDAIVLYIQTEIRLVNEKCYNATGIKFIMLEDQFNGGLKEVCYPVYNNGITDIPYTNCSTSRKIILGTQMINSLKNLIGSNDLPIIADRCEALDSDHLEMLGSNQLFITQVSDDEQILLIQK